MQAHLLRTKLHIPALRPFLVPRPHLIQKLNQHPDAKLTLISAPAGSGKTTLLTQFINQQQQPVAWLSLDEADDDPNQFWTYLITACQSVLAGAGELALSMLDASQPLPGNTIPTILLNDIASQNQKLLLILDDYHTIQNPSIQESMSFLLDYLPDNVHLIISTRADPPWPLSRYRVRNHLVEIRVQDLRFSLEETANFLNQTMGLDLSAGDVAALEARTEGWVAGLQLAAIAMQSPQPEKDVSAFVQAFAGSHLFVAEYLLEDVLRRQPEATQRFLLQTSILERLNGELCDAVTKRQDSQTMLATLHRANLFVVPLDDEGCWFRYHHLFADLLQARLLQTMPTEDVACLHMQAASWHEQNGLIQAAIRHAMAAKDFERVAALVENEARAMMFSGQANILRNWLSTLPEAIIEAHPRLKIYQLWIDMLQEKADLSPAALQEKENMLRALPSSPENERLQMELLAVLCRFVAFSGNTTRAIQIAEEAQTRLPEAEIALRARTYSALAVAHWMEGHPQKAGQAYEQCMILTQATGDYSLIAHATMMMGMSHTDYGQLHEALHTYQTIIDMGKQAGQRNFFPAVYGYIGLASIYLEWNEWDTAVSHLEQGMKLCRQGGLTGISFGHTLQARLFQAQGMFAEAAAEMALLGETGVDPTGTARHIQLCLAQNDLEEAARLAKPWRDGIKASAVGPQPPLLVAEIVKVTLARLFLAQGELRQAEQLLDDVLVTAVPQKRNGRLIEVYLLKALLQQAQNQEKAAVESITHALELAQPEGYVLLFVEGGTAVIPLLQAVITDQTTAAPVRQYAQKLLATFQTDDKTISHPVGTVAGLIEALTPREIEVLHLVVAGDTNQEIADKLVITVRTVKKHITNILGKLGVSNRTQAVARARELGLITYD